MTSFFIFVGPSGAGKTGAICKILAKLRVENKVCPSKLKMITMDTLNVGARKVFEQWGEYLQVQTAACATIGDLNDELERCSGKEYVFIDLSGHSSRTTETLSFISDLSRQFEPSWLILVASATSSLYHLEEIVTDYKKSDLHFNGSIVTKRDETESKDVEIRLSESEEYTPIAFINGTDAMNTVEFTEKFLEFPMCNRQSE